MIRYLIILIAAFVITMAALSKFTFAQTETPTPTNTPTQTPSGAPKTGMGWGQ